MSQYLDRHAADVSRGGIFVRNIDVLPVGRAVRLNLQLGDGSTLLVGEGTVFWTREADPTRAESEPGMGIRFTRLTPDSQRMLTFLLAEKAERERLEDADFDGEERTVVATEAELRAAAESGDEDLPAPVDAVQLALATALTPMPPAPKLVAVPPATPADAQHAGAGAESADAEPLFADDDLEPAPIYSDGRADLIPLMTQGEVELTDLVPKTRGATAKRVGVGVVIGGAALAVWFGLLARPAVKPSPVNRAAVASAAAERGRPAINPPEVWSATSAGYAATPAAPAALGGGLAANPANLTNVAGVPASASTTPAGATLLPATATPTTP